MKYQELDNRQKKAFTNIKNAASDYIFGMLNGCYDSETGSDEYNEYASALKDLDGLIKTVYREATTNIYGDGMCSFGARAESYMKDIRFCGKDFLMGVVKRFCEKYQKEALAEIE